MKNGNVNAFVDKTTIEECAVMYGGVKYFFHGLLFDSESKTYSFTIDIWDENGDYVKTVFDKTATSASECMELAFAEPIFDGKSFWEAETEMEWVEW